MPKPEIKSILDDKLNAIFTATSMEEAKRIFLEVVNASIIKIYDKNKMIFNLNNCRTLLDVQKYAVNSAFKFEGLSVIK